MEHVAHIITPTGLVATYPPGGHFTAKQLIDGIGGYFVLLRPQSCFGAILVARRDFDGLPFNPTATRIMTTPPRPPILVFGTAVLCRDEHIK